MYTVERNRNLDKHLIIDNNLRPDRLAGPKALGPKHYRLHNLYLEVHEFYMILSCTNFGQGIPYTHYFNVAYTTHRGRAYAHFLTVWAELRTHHLLDGREYAPLSNFKKIWILISKL